MDGKELTEKRVEETKSLMLTLGSKVDDALQFEGDIIARSINGFSKMCNDAATAGGWWHDLNLGISIVRNKGELLCLIHSEISEAMEGVRKDCADDKLPHRKMEEVELADALVRIFDYAGAHELDLGGALVEKMIYNRNRADHKPENREKEGGKKF